jgi:two-component system, LytTR family, response regulator
MIANHNSSVRGRMLTADASFKSTSTSRTSAGELQVLIADSLAASRERLRSLLTSRRGVRIVAECSDGPQTLDAISRLRPQLAFMDVQLPRLDAFTLFARLGDLAPRVVLVTASPEYAARAFDIPALDFIVKPYSDHRLLAALDRAQETIGSAAAARTLLREVRGRGNELLVVRSRGNHLHLLPMHEIVWIESHGTSVRVHTTNKSHVVPHTIGEMEARLPKERFMRVNREAILNLAQIDEVRRVRSDFELVLLDGSALALGRRYRKNFEQRIEMGRLALDP